MASQTSTSNFNQALWLGLGQLSTAALSFVSAAILARYFDKNDYGTYKQVLYIYTTLSSLFIVGLPSAFGYFLPRLNSGEQKQLIKGINRLFVISGAAFSLVLFFGADLIADILNNPDLSLAIRLFSPFPLFTLPTLGVEGIYTALKRTKSVAIYIISSRVISLVFIITPVIFFDGGYIGVIIGWGLANFIIFVWSMYMKSRPYTRISPELIPNMYKSIFDYCLPLVGAFIAGFAISSASQFFISRYYGTAAFADFSNGNFSIPFVAMIGGAIKSVLTPIISKAHHKKNFTLISQTYGNACSNAIILIFPMLIFTIFFAEPVMTFIYGEKYYTSAPYLRMFIIRDFCSVLPYFSILMAFGLSKLYMLLHVAGALFVWTSDSLCVYLFNTDPSFMVFNDSLFHILCSVIVFIVILRRYKLNLFPNTFLKKMGIVLLHCALSSALALLAVGVVTNYINALTPFKEVIIGGIIYFIILVPSGYLLKLDYLQVLMRLKNDRFSGS